MNAHLVDTRWAPRRPGERLAVALTAPAAPAAGGAILFGPHPLLGGDMDNNVVRALAVALADAGSPALRFDYRGVGCSEALDPGRPRYEVWSEVEERGDLGAVLADADEALRRASRLFEPELLVGYSFGACVALRFADERGLDLPLVLVCPPLAHFDFDPLATREAASVLVFAAQDGFDPPPPAGELAARFPRSAVRVLAGTDHFFRGHEELLSRTVLELRRSNRPMTP